MKTKVINLYDKSKAVKVVKCGVVVFGSDRLVKMRAKLHIKKCQECQELLKQNK